ncbi:MAG: GntR family transcriptional regulator [Ruthenibacterium sp.]
MDGNLNQSTSIYLQIAEMLETQILRDILCEEEQTPSTNELAKAFAINPATAAKGINLLVDEGILYKKRGIGMFVASGSKEKIRAKRKKAFCDTYVQGFLTEAAALSISKEELIAMIQNSAENA